MTRRHRTVTRVVTALLLSWLVLPVVGEDDRSRIDGEIGVGGGRMSLIGANCYGLKPDPANYVGAHGRIRTQSEEIGDGQLRTEAEVSGELRFAGSAYRDGMTTTGIARVMVGLSSRHYGVRVGGWGGNVGLDEQPMGFLAGSIRLGLPHRHLRLAFMDQPGCLLANCVFGAEFLWTRDDVAVLVGGSGGMVGGRGYVKVPFRLGHGLPWLRPGIDIGADTYGNLTFTLTVGLGMSSG